jgi:SPP1 family predicted phage head-tail adaptor
VPTEAGKLRHRVELQREVAGGPDSFGEPAGAGWETYAERWARVEPLSGRELWRAQQQQPDVTHRVTLRAGGLVGELHTGHRVLHAGRNLHVRAIRNLEERGEVLELDCCERV